MDLKEGQASGNGSFAQSLSTPGNRSGISGMPSRQPRRLSRLRALALAGLLVLTACSPAPRSSESLPAHGEWREFQGTWTAAGNRQTMGLGGNRRVSIAQLEGSLLLAGPSRPATGFRAEAIVFNDSVTGMVGRAVWTDERGDQAYSELQGEGTATGNKIVGTFLGGTGRYSDVKGDYEFSWRFVLEGEDGNIQGQSIGLKGRVRAEPQQGTSGAGGPQS